MAKFFGVSGNQRQIENERVTGNQQIVRTDWRSRCLQFKTQRAGAASSVRIELYFFDNIEQRFHLLRFASRVPCASGSDKQFKTGNG